MEERYVVETIEESLLGNTYAVTISYCTPVLETTDKDFALDLCQALNTARFNRLNPDDGK
jgi:hypothetical protein